MSGFTRNEARTVYLIQKIRGRPSTRARRSAIRVLKAVLLVYRAQLRAAAAGGGWDKRARRWRYAALLAVYKADPLPSRKVSDPGQLALAAAGRMVGKRETGDNDAAWLRQMEDDLPHDRLDWMIPGNPYCGFGCIWSWWAGARLLLPDGTVYTPNICPWGGTTQGQVRFVRCRPEDAKPGALVVMHFGSGGAKHVAMARGPMRNGQIPCREFNTSPSNAGSQANGGGCWDRTRPRGFVLCTLNVEPV